MSVHKNVLVQSVSRIQTGFRESCPLSGSVRPKSFDCTSRVTRMRPRRLKHYPEYYFPRVCPNVSVNFAFLYSCVFPGVLETKGNHSGLSLGRAGVRRGRSMIAKYSICSLLCSPSFRSSPFPPFCAAGALWKDLALIGYMLRLALQCCHFKTISTLYGHLSAFYRQSWTPLAFLIFLSYVSPKHDL